MIMIDVSLFPVFEAQNFKMVGELREVYDSKASAANKVARFETILKKFDCLP